jgi:NAD(P)H-hydrate epimerase
MLKILNAAQIKSCDAYTIQHEPVASIDLMERACRAFVSWFTPRFNVTQKIGVVCGTGNNGGDGLGIARMLIDWGYSVKVWVVRGEVKTSEDFTMNLSRLSNKANLFDITSEADQGLFHDRQVIIDAIFGSGLSRPVEGIYAQAIACINKTQAITIAVDIPSGLLPDRHSTGSIVEADHTVSFHLPKLAFMMPENNSFVGIWHRVDIGLSKRYLEEVGVSYFFLTRTGVRGKLRPRSKFDHKGNNGRALLIAGSYGKMGACILAARAALRSGIGLLTLHVPPSGYNIVQTAVPEAMAAIDANERMFTAAGPVEAFDVIGIGPGIGQDQKTAGGFAGVLQQGKPMVIDADGLNILSGHRELLHRLPSGSILTPHPKEFERLTGPWSDDFDRLEKQKQLASETKSVIVLKGAHSSIALPDGNVFFNSTGNPGMATGGSGDVLTGILTGLLAQGYSAGDAAILGVYLHGLSGDLAYQEKGMNSLIASDLVDQIPQAFRKIAG